MVRGQVSEGGGIVDRELEPSSSLQHIQLTFALSRRVSLLCTFRTRNAFLEKSSFGKYAYSLLLAMETIANRLSFHGYSPLLLRA